MGVWRCPKCGYEFRVAIRVLAVNCPQGHVMQPVAGPVPTKGKHS